MVVTCASKGLDVRSVLNEAVMPRTRELQKLGIVNDTVGAEPEGSRPRQQPLVRKAWVACRKAAKQGKEQRLGYEPSRNDPKSIIEQHMDRRIQANRLSMEDGYRRRQHILLTGAEVTDCTT